MVALNSTINGPSTEKLLANFGPVLGWIFSTAENPSQRVKCCTSYLLSQLARTCPSLFHGDEGNLTQFIHIFRRNFSNNEHPKIIIYSIQAAQQLFVATEKELGRTDMLSPYFVEFLNCCVGKILDKQFID